MSHSHYPDTIAVSTNEKINHVVDDPYRYQCPECGCHTIIIRTHNGYAANYKEVERTMNGKQGTVRDYRCTQCGSTFDRVYDKKTDSRQPNVHE